MLVTAVSSCRHRCLRLRITLAWQLARASSTLGGRTLVAFKPIGFIARVAALVRGQGKQCADSPTRTGIGSRGSVAVAPAGACRAGDRPEPGAGIHGEPAAWVRAVHTRGRRTICGGPGLEQGPGMRRTSCRMPRRCRSAGGLGVACPALRRHPLARGSSRRRSGCRMPSERAGSSIGMVVCSRPVPEGENP